MLRAAPALLALLLLAGCLGQGGPASLLPPALAPLAVGDAVRIDGTQPAREPAIVQAPDGTLYVAGFWGFARVVEKPGQPANLAQQPLLWKSTDEGATWARVDTGLPVLGGVGNSDPALAVDAQSRLYYVTLSYYSAPVPAGLPLPALPADPATTLSVFVGATADQGQTWAWTRLDQGSGHSHPWVAAAPDGTVHAVWADGMGIHHAASPDHGTTWAEGARVTQRGEAGSLGAAPDGSLAVRVAPIGEASPEGADGVAVSRDGGSTWAYHPLPGDRTGEEPHGFDGAAFDAAGVLYAAWNQGQAVWLGASRDLGATWDTFVLAREPEGTVPYFPYVRGGAAGELGVSWFAQTGQVVAARGAWVQGADQAAPRVRLGTFLEDTGGTNHADYFQVELLQGGGLGAPVPVTTSDRGQWFDFRVAM
jgi:hypothetical protein